MLASMMLLVSVALLGYLSDSPTKPAATAAVVAAAAQGMAETNSVDELRIIEADDDAAQAEIEQWQRADQEQKAKGAAVSKAELEGRIAKRIQPVRRAYEAFLNRHPENARGHLLFGSFLNDHGEEQAAQLQWERALKLDPTNAVVYNNLAGRYSESGPLNKAFEFYARAIELGPDEPVYYHNFADSLYVLRKPAAAYYGISEQQVFVKTLLLYSNTLQLAPTNLAFARDLAQTYYSLRPLPVEAALSAWTNALRLAREQTDREEVYLHLARIKMLNGRLAEARAQLAAVTNQAWLQAKTNLLRILDERERPHPAR